MPESITEIVNAAKQGDTAAFTSLVIRFQDMAMGLAYGALGDEELARDAAQEAFLDAFLHLDQLRLPEAFAGWFRKVVMKHCNRQVRRKEIPRTAIDEMPEFHDDNPAADDILMSYQERVLIRESIEKLPQHERLVTAMHYLAGEPLKAIASLLEIPLGTIKKRLYSARQRLKKRSLEMTEKTLESMRPSASKEFTTTIGFFHAVRTGDRTSVRDILQKHPELADARVRWEMQDALDHGFPNLPGPSPMIWAIMRDDADMVALLLENGAPMEGSLFNALAYGALKTARLLLEKGADPNDGAKKGVSALHAASIRGLTEMIEPLVTHGADIELRSRYDLRPIDYAQIKGNTDIVKKLKDLGSNAASTSIGLKKQTDTGTGIYWTGIKALDLFAPIQHGSIVRFDSFLNVGSNVLLMEIIYNSWIFKGIPSVLVNCRGGFGPPYMLYKTNLASMPANHIHYVEYNPDEVHSDGNTAQRAVDLAKRLLDKGFRHVLIAFFMQAGYESEVESIFPSLNQDDSTVITAILEWPLPTADIQTCRDLSPPIQTRICFDATLRERHHYPCIHPLLSRSSKSTPEHIGEKHHNIQEQARELLRSYRELNPTLDPEIATKVSNDQLKTVLRAQKLQAFLTQPFHVAEIYGGLIGAYVSQDELLDGVQRILDGEFDTIPVRNFMMKGSIESALTKESNNL